MYVPSKIKQNAVFKILVYSTMCHEKTPKCGKGYSTRIILEVIWSVTTITVTIVTIKRGGSKRQYKEVVLTGYYSICSEMGVPIVCGFASFFNIVLQNYHKTATIQLKTSKYSVILTVAWTWTSTRLILSSFRQGQTFLNARVWEIMQFKYKIWHTRNKKLQKKYHMRIIDAMHELA